MKLLTRTAKISLIALGFLILLIIVLFGYQDIPLEDLKAKYTNAASAFIKVGGMDVHYRDEGPSTDSIPIVLIHGTGASLHTFEDWVSELKTKHRVVHMDLPAYGLTGPFPNREYSITNYVEFVKDFLTKIGIEKCILGGNSLGGGIAWNFTVAYPEMVEKLILIDASGYPSQSKSTPLAFQVARMPIIKNIFTFITPRFVARASVENVYADKSKVSDELADRYFELTLRKGNRQAFIDRFEAKRDVTAYSKIKSIEQETLVLWGAEDDLIQVENAYKFHRDLPNDTLVILENVGHVPMEESPQESLAAVRAFLDED